MKAWLIIAFFFVNISALSAGSSINVYSWGGEIPSSVLKAFERSTGIEVHFSTYDSNETLYTKLTAGQSGVYDVIVPSAYVVEHMKKSGMLETIDQKQLTNLHNLDPYFQNNAYDPHNQYSIPLVWGATGIFYNKNLIKKPPTHWKDLWEQRWRNQLMLLDDPREIFALTMIRLGYSVDESGTKEIQAANTTLHKLVPNIKLFVSEGVQALMIDEDANIGTAWSGDAFKAHLENSAINFIYPREGFVVWIDCLAIPRNPPHPHAAHQFINFLLRPEIAAEIARQEGHAITNAPGKLLLSAKQQHNPWVYPSKKVLQRGHVQRDLSDAVIKQYSKDWLALKLAF